MDLDGSVLVGDRIVVHGDRTFEGRSHRNFDRGNIASLPGVIIANFVNAVIGSVPIVIGCVLDILAVGCDGALSVPTGVVKFFDGEVWPVGDGRVVEERIGEDGGVERGGHGVVVRGDGGIVASGTRLWYFAMCVSCGFRLFVTIIT